MTLPDDRPVENNTPHENPTVGELIERLSAYPRDEYVAVVLPQAGLHESIDVEHGEHPFFGFSPHLYVIENLSHPEEDGDHSFVAEFPGVVIAPNQMVTIPDE